MEAPARPAPPVAVAPGATSLRSLQRRRLGDVLVAAGVITDAALREVLTAQRDAVGPRRRLGELLVELRLTDERAIANALASQLGLETIDLTRVQPAPDAVRLLPQEVANRAGILVVDRSPQGLVVATADPTNVIALDDVRLYTGANSLVVRVAAASAIRDQLARAWSLGGSGSGGSSVSTLVEDDALFDGAEAPRALEADTSSQEDESTPIVRLVTKILGDAVRLRASDIHVETQRAELRVRYRIDGVLRDVMTTSRRAAGTVVSRLKIMSGLDIAERRVPQDGRARISVDGTAIDCRVSTLPALHGEKVVIRLLSRGEDITPLESLGFDPPQYAAFTRALSVPQGLVLITGPTGSGKTNTLYSALAKILTPEKNIVTLEDPVEVQLPGITQVQVNVRAGMTFQAGLRSILRQDPDIVLVGEVRDTETAELALKASLTGHLVLTTLHTNSAAAALTRLVDMGAQPFLVASSLTASIAQRLVRRPCAACAAPYVPEEDVMVLLELTQADLAGATPRRGAGCPECGGTGYRGRTAVYEILSVDAEMRAALMHDASETAISEVAARQGMVTLRGSAIAKAMRGETTFEEALRVT